MSIRNRLEKLEHTLLSEYASKSDESLGRENPVSADDLRTEYQRDRDRIIHCKSFRRLKHKTQMFFAQDGEYYRTRLTHTMEVSQLARTLARSLRLNEDLAEAISLGHDLGHTPFGHTGERTLERITGHFLHNEQSLRVVERIENGTGLNLTWEVRDGILNHSGGLHPATLEGQCVHLADRIAYINHDIDDAIRYGLIAQEDLPSELLDALGDTHGRRIDTMVLDIVRYSEGGSIVSMSPSIKEATDGLRDFLFERVYSMSIDKLAEEQAGHIIRHLFEYYRDNMEFKEGEPESVQISDFISGMTDAFAANTYKRLFIPEPWR